MIASYDHRERYTPVTLTMSATEFTEMVEWLESLAGEDGATRHWRAEHDRVMPRPEEEP